MGKFYRANQEVRQLLKDEGLVFHDREESGVNYFTDHRTGRQVLVNQKRNYIKFLDNRGILVGVASSFTDNQIKDFLRKE
jgi:hypothetical protein